jgi:hypothetical protein
VYPVLIPGRFDSEPMGREGGGMQFDVILTTEEHGALIEKPIRRAAVTLKTDCRALLETMATRYFGPAHNVRRDSNLFGWVAVSKDGDTLHLQ